MVVMPHVIAKLQRMDGNGLGSLAVEHAGWMARKFAEAGLRAGELQTLDLAIGYVREHRKRGAITQPFLRHWRWRCEGRSLQVWFSPRTARLMTYRIRLLETDGRAGW